MNKFFSGIRDKLIRFMYGRYGFDELSTVMDLTAIILILLSYIPDMYWLSLIAWVLLILALVRGFSRNISKRRNELNKYLSIKRKITDKFSLYKRMIKERRTHVYFKCRDCRALLRVPKGRGEIVVTCPKCGVKHDKKT